jgi:LPXTG-motif cell wall-anchored protein
LSVAFEGLKLVLGYAGNAGTQMTSILLIGLLIALATLFMLVKSRKVSP